MTEESPYWTVGFPHRPSVTTAVSAGSGAVSQAVRPESVSSPKEAGTKMVCLNCTSPPGSTSTHCKFKNESDPAEIASVCVCTSCVCSIRVVASITQLHLVTVLPKQYHRRGGAVILNTIQQQDISYTTA